MSSFSTAIVIKALDGLTARSVVTAQNIANAQSPGYRPLRVSFETALADAAAKSQGAVDQVAPRIEVAGEPDSLRLDMELATATQTTMRYGALIEVLNRQMQLTALAVSGGR